MKLSKILTGSIGAFFLVSAINAQEFDAQEFERELNNALRDLPGVTFRVDNDLATVLGVESVSSHTIKEIELIQNLQNPAPEFGFLVRDRDGNVIDVVGGNVPFVASSQSVVIQGYALPAGGTVETIGRAGWIEASNELALSRVQAPSRDIGRVVDAVTGASDYIAQELCTSSSRPTQITLNLTAGFELVFSASTGSQITWDLEVVCAR